MVLGSNSLACNWTFGSFGTQTTSRTIIVGTVGSPVITGPASLCYLSGNYSVNTTPGHHYRWTVNGATKSYSSSLLIIADNQLTYNVVVYDSIGSCGASASMVVTNAVFPHPLITGNSNQCQNSPATLSVSAVTGATYSWGLSGGSILSGSGTNSIQAVFPNWSYETANLTVDVGGCARTASKTLAVFPSTMPDLGPDVYSCASVPITLTNNNWVIDPNTTYSSNAGPTNGDTIGIPGFGTYTMSATTTGYGTTCVGTDTVVYGMLPNVNTNLGPDFIACTPTVTLRPTFTGSTGPYTYLWSTGATSDSILATPGTYSVTVSAPGFCTDFDSITLFPPSMPPVSFAPNTQTICPWSTTILDAGAGYASYDWSTSATTQTITVNPVGAYTVTATDSTSCVSTATLTLSHYLPPALILGNDTTICPDTFAVFTSAPFASYLWSNGDTTQSIQAALGGNYVVTVTDFNGCPWMDTAVVYLFNDCLWPGDANHDGLANNFDILDIGFAMNANGPLRLDPSTSWYGRLATNWTQTFPSLLNYKHADSDGDGLIDYPDTLVVIQNYGLSHNKASGVNSGPILQFAPLQTNYLVGDTVRIGIYLGDAGNPAIGTNGLAYSVYVGGITTNPGDVWFSFPMSFLGNIGINEMAIAFEDVGPGQHDLVHTRLGAFPVNGYGLIAIMNIRTDSLLLPNGHNPLTFDFSGVYMVDDNFQSLPISTMPNSLDVRSLSALEVSASQSPLLQTYPVPADNVLHVRCDGDFASMEVQLYDLAGKRCKRVKMEAPITDLSLDDLSEGTYLLCVFEADKVIARTKITVLHR
jgi:hypothetical protein